MRPCPWPALACRARVVVAAVVALAACAAAIALATVALAGCALPRHVDRPISTARSDTAGTMLGREIAPAVAAHPGESGFLYNSFEGALQARVALADVAQSALDA